VVTIPGKMASHGFHDPPAVEEPMNEDDLHSVSVAFELSDRRMIHSGNPIWSVMSVDSSVVQC
jgi:hypothetical protein